MKPLIVIVVIAKWCDRAIYWNFSHWNGKDSMNERRCSRYIGYIVWLIGVRSLWLRFEEEKNDGWNLIFARMVLFGKIRKLHNRDGLMVRIDLSSWLKKKKKKKKRFSSFKWMSQHVVTPLSGNVVQIAIGRWTNQFQSSSTSVLPWIIISWSKSMTIIWFSLLEC